MPRAAKTTGSPASELARQLVESLGKERLVPRFVDSYVVEYERYGLQAHPQRYRELIAVLSREALLAMCAHALEGLPADQRATRKRSGARDAKRGARMTREQLLAALTKVHQWSAGDALDFQSDLALYAQMLSRAPRQARRRKPFEVAEGPFVDRCALLLDPSMMDKARFAAGKLLVELQRLTATLVAKVLATPIGQ
ncbi:MAG TPA: hypothetical protein VOA41_06050 [Candidatus Dormibacteraeota bacterium]|nr:hypothetical protein [Candidatus Dormibacteraeota bacterium]